MPSDRDLNRAEAIERASWLTTGVYLVAAMFIPGVWPLLMGGGWAGAATAAAVGAPAIAGVHRAGKAIDRLNGNADRYRPAQAAQAGPTGPAACVDCGEPLPADIRDFQLLPGCHSGRHYECPERVGG